MPARDAESDRHSAYVEGLGLDAHKPQTADLRCHLLGLCTGAATIPLSEHARALDLSWLQQRGNGRRTSWYVYARSLHGVLHTQSSVTLYICQLGRLAGAHILSTPRVIEAMKAVDRGLFTENLQIRSGVFQHKPWLSRKASMADLVSNDLC